MRWPGRDFLTLHGWILAGRLGFLGIERDRERLRQWAAEGVLVTACTALGDAVLCTPLLRVLRREFPSGRLGFLVRHDFFDLFEHHGRGVRAHPYFGKYRRTGQVVADLRSGAYRLALVSNANDPDVMPLLYRAGVRGFLRRPTRHTAYAGWMANPQQMRRPSDPDYATGHAVVRNLQMAEWLGAKVSADDYPTEVFFAREDAEAVESLPGFSGQPLVGVHPGASKPFKKWPAVHFRDLIERLAGAGARVCVTGSAGERAAATAICEGLVGSPLNLAGRLTLRQMAALMKKLRVFVSGDTGPYHVAMAVGCPTVTWFAPQDPGSDVGAVGPFFGGDRHVALRPAHFRDPVSGISVDRVWREVERFLK